MVQLTPIHHTRLNGIKVSVRDSRRNGETLWGGGVTDKDEDPPLVVSTETRWAIWATSALRRVSLQVIEDEKCSGGVNGDTVGDLKHSGDSEKGGVTGENSRSGSMFSIDMAGAKSVRTLLVSTIFDGEFGCVYYSTWSELVACHYGVVIVITIFAF